MRLIFSFNVFHNPYHFLFSLLFLYCGWWRFKINNQLRYESGKQTETICMEFDYD